MVVSTAIPCFDLDKLPPTTETLYLAEIPATPSSSLSISFTDTLSGIAIERRRSRLEEWIIAASSPIPRTIEGSSEGIFLLMRCMSPASPSCSIYITHLTVDLSQGYQRLVFFSDDFFTTFFVFFETATFRHWPVQHQQAGVTGSFHDLLAKFIQ